MCYYVGFSQIRSHMSETCGIMCLTSYKMKSLPTIITTADKDASCYVIDYYKYSKRCEIYSYSLKISIISSVVYKISILLWTPWIRLNVNMLLSALHFKFIF